MTKIESNNQEYFRQKLEEILPASISKVELDPEKAENGLVKLVLSLVEVIRELLEKQALRKVENDQLREEEIEKLGLTLMKLEETVEYLKDHFHLSDEDLKLNLGLQKID